MPSCYRVTATLRNMFLVTTQEFMHYMKYHIQDLFEHKNICQSKCAKADTAALFINNVLEALHYIPS